MQLDKKYVALAKKISLLEQQLKDANAEISRQREIISELESEIERSIIHSENENILDTIKDRRTGRITDDAKQQIIEAFRNGSSTRTIARQFDISRHTVVSIVAAWNKDNPGNEIKTQRIEKTPHDVELAIVAYINQGNTWKATAKKFNIHKNTVSRILKRHGNANAA